MNPSTELVQRPSVLCHLHRRAYLYIKTQEEGVTSWDIQNEFDLHPSTTSSLMWRLAGRGFIRYTGKKRAGRNGVQVRIYKENKLLCICVECDRPAYRFWGTAPYCGKHIDAAIRVDPDAHDCPECGERQPHNIMWRKDAPCSWCQQAKADKE